MLDNASVMPLDSFHINFLTFPCYWGVRKGNMNCKNKWGCCSRFSQTDINLYCQTANKLLGQCVVCIFTLQPLLVPHLLTQDESTWVAGYYAGYVQSTMCNVTVCHPPVYQSCWYTHCDSPGGSIQCSQWTFHPDNKDQHTRIYTWFTIRQYQ